MKILILVAVIIVISIIILIKAILVNNKATNMEEGITTVYNKIGLNVDKRYRILKQGLTIMKEHNDNFSETYEKIMKVRGQEEESYFSQEQNIRRIYKEVNVLVEKYPEIGKVYDSQELMVNMHKVEDELYEVRNEYNGVIKKYNAYIRVMPNNLFLSGKKPYPYFKIDDDELKEKEDYIMGDEYIV